jgi:hypothetical protein
MQNFFSDHFFREEIVQPPILSKDGRDEKVFKNLSNVRLPGVDVMTTITCDFSRFSAGKFGVFLLKINNVMVKLLLKLAVVEQKTAMFTNFRRKKCYD